MSGEGKYPMVVLGEYKYSSVCEFVVMLLGMQICQHVLC